MVTQKQAIRVVILLCLVAIALFFLVRYFLEQDEKDEKKTSNSKDVRTSKGSLKVQPNSKVLNYETSLNDPAQVSSDAPWWHGVTDLTENSPFEITSHGGWWPATDEDQSAPGIAIDPEPKDIPGFQKFELPYNGTVIVYPSNFDPISTSQQPEILQRLHPWGSKQR